MISEGDIYIGAGETYAIHVIANAAHQLQLQYPKIRYHITSGDTADVLDKLDKGLLDFGVLFGTIDQKKYESIEIPLRDQYGILMPKNCALALKSVVTPEDLWGKPLICNRSIRNGDEITTWLRKNLSQLHIAATYNLLYNASIMVKEGIGYAICLDKIIHLTKDSPLCFRPLTPPVEARMTFIWKKFQIFSKASEISKRTSEFYTINTTGFY